LPTGEVIIEGPVILDIERVADAPGSAIRVTWLINKTDYPQYSGSQVDIYYARGNGTGQYPSSFASKMISGDKLAAGSPANVSITGAKSLEWDGQVGQGDNELYFIGCLAGRNINTEQAVAVGKVNVALAGEAASEGQNLIAVPFLPQPGASVAEVFGEGSGAVWEEGDLVQKKVASSPSYISAIYKDNAWKDLSRPTENPKFDIDPLFGNWVIVKSSKDITLVGKVINIPMDVAVYDGAGLATGGKGGKTLLGTIYPLEINLTDTSLITDGAAEGDLMQYKVSPLAPSYVSAIVIGGAWKNLSDPNKPLDPGIATLKVPNSYIFVRTSDTGFVWKRQSPYK
jgi:hypothetical protein